MEPLRFVRWAALGAALFLPAAGQAAEVAAWPVDPLVKVLRNFLPPVKPTPAVTIEAARGEIENGQIAYRSDQPLARVSATATPLRGPGGQEIPAPWVRHLGYVRINRNTEAHLGETGIISPIAQAPAEFPDPLLEDSAVSAKANETGAVWLTVTVPQTAAPGIYQGEVVLTADGTEKRVPVSLQVYSATLPAAMNLKVVNWYFPSVYRFIYNVQPDSEQYWQLVDAEAKKMAAHRYSVGDLQIHELIDVVEQPGGQVTFDFSRFDRQVEAFRRAGLPWIMGSHLAGRSEWMGKDFYALGFPFRKLDGTKGSYPIPEDPKSPDKEKKFVWTVNPKFEQWMGQLLPALQKHLEDKGWANSYIQQLADEPTPPMAAAYRRLGEMVRKYAPKFRRADALRTRDVVGGLDIWVPLSSDLENPAFYKERQKAGDEVWFYTCERPRGLYMNRFIDHPLLRGRLMYWAEYGYGATGFLHWGYNASWGNPFQNADSPAPAGDGCIVYPGVAKMRGAPDSETKMHSLDSIRFEAERDGIEDYELFRLLAKKDQKRADAIYHSVVTSLTRYSVDPAVFNSARRELLKALSE